MTGRLTSPAVTCLQNWPLTLVVNLCIPKFNLNFMRNSFTYKCAQLWNKLPEDVKLADNVDILKAKLKLIQL